MREGMKEIGNEIRGMILTQEENMRDELDRLRRDQLERERKWEEERRKVKEKMGEIEKKLSRMKIMGNRDDMQNEEVEKENREGGEKGGKNVQKKE